MPIFYILAVCNNDGAQNNGETGVDCGGGGCSDCGMFLFMLLSSFCGIIL